VASRILPAVALSILGGNFSTPGKRTAWRSERIALT